MTSDHVAHATLLALVAAGDEDALRQLYAAFRPRLRRYLWHQLGGDTLAVEEMLQDVFLAVWRTASAYRGEAKVATWIFQIAHYLVIHARHRQSRYADAVSTDGSDEEDTPHPSWQSVSHEDEVIDRLTLADALAHLSTKHREVLDLVSRQGFSLEEVAQILDVPTGTVKSRLSYAHLSYAHKALLRELCPQPVEERRRDA